MRLFKDICGLLLTAGFIVGVGQFLPVLGVLFDNYLFGFALTVMAILICRVMYRYYMIRVNKLPSDVRRKREKEGQEGWDETCEATFSLSESFDPRNMTNIDIRD